MGMQEWEMEAAVGMEKKQDQRQHWNIGGSGDARKGDGSHRGDPGKGSVGGIEDVDNENRDSSGNTI